MTSRYEVVRRTDGGWAIFDLAMIGFCSLPQVDGEEGPRKALAFDTVLAARSWLVECAERGLEGAVDPAWRVWRAEESWVAVRRWPSPDPADPQTLIANTPQELAEELLEVNGSW